MADIVTNAEMAAQQKFGLLSRNTSKGAKLVERFRLQKRVLEERDAFIGRFKETAGLRLERERNALAGSALHIDEIGDSHHQVASHRSNGFA